MNRPGRWGTPPAGPAPPPSAAGYAVGPAGAGAGPAGTGGGGVSGSSGHVRSTLRDYPMEDILEHDGPERDEEPDDDDDDDSDDDDDDDYDVDEFVDEDDDEEAPPSSTPSQIDEDEAASDRAAAAAAPVRREAPGPPPTRSTLQRRARFEDHRLERHAASPPRDVETGDGAGRRERFHHAMLRSMASMRPTNLTTRRRRHLEKKINEFMRKTGLEADNATQDMTKSMRGRLQVHAYDSTHAGAGTGGGEEDDRGRTQHYRLTAVSNTDRTAKSRFLEFIGMTDFSNPTYEDARAAESCAWCCCGSPELWVRRFFFWAFRSTFAAVFLAAVLGFMVLTNLFAIGIYSIWHRKPSCVGGSEVNPGWYIDAFALSWTTFATVGYGAIHPAISATEQDIHKCAGITMLVCLESFIGILFGSMFAAIMLVKVSRIQSYAHVDFSGPMVVRYGGDLDEPTKKDTTGEESCEAFEMTNIPCPYIEIRMVNLMSSVKGGELVDCSVNVVASIEEAQACQAVRDLLRIRRGPKGRKNPALLGRQRMMQQAGFFGGDADQPVGPMDRANLFRMVDESMRARQENAHQIFEEDESGYLIPKRIFSRLELESPSHPFFNRTWVLRHVLNEQSPLLNNFARQAVQKNNGFWPRELNNYQGVRAAIAFDQIMVNFTATSNAGGNSVYAQKMYDRSDMYVGYQHVSMVYTTGDGQVAIDYSLTHDISEQQKGGGEPIEAKNTHANPAHLMMLL